jgi:hypothetical protein
MQYSASPPGYPGAIPASWQVQQQQPQKQGSHPQLEVVFMVLAPPPPPTLCTCPRQNVHQEVRATGIQAFSTAAGCSPLVVSLCGTYISLHAAVPASGMLLAPAGDRYRM